MTPKGSARISSEDMFLSSRFALTVGFGTLLSIMALAGVDALHALRQFQHSDEQIRQMYLAQNHVLNDIRSDVYLSGTYVRDYLLEPETQRAEAYRTSLAEVHNHMESALEAYRRHVSPAELQHYSALRAELTDYWQTLAPIFQWDPAERHRAGYSFLRDQLFPRRQNMLALAGSIADINEQQLASGNYQAVSLLLRFQTRLLLTIVAAVVLGSAMALFTMRKILGLEKQSRQQYGQLKELSARLLQAQETERRALSRELHDEVGQLLSAVLIELRNLFDGLAVWSGEQSRRHVETIKGLVETTVRVVRNMALLLRPSMLDDLGLIPALKWQAREASKRTSMDVSVTTDLDSDDLPEDYKTCIYRVVQEALHNCARHSRANTVRIAVCNKVQQGRDHLMLVIQDDGRGFDARQQKGLGLLGIQERAKQLGGICTVDSELGKGTTLSVILPFHTRAGSVEIHEADSHPVS